MTFSVSVIDVQFGGLNPGSYEPTRKMSVIDCLLCYSECLINHKHIFLLSCYDVEM